jgi:curved DNA-binding protein CbpA
MPEPKNPQTSATDLSEELVQRIESLHERLASLDYFTLLGVPRSATRAQVRHAFLALAPTFHPDKYFGKKLGPYSSKMQRIFAQMSLAHDTLVDEEARAAYESTIPPPAPAPRQSSQPDPAEMRRTQSSVPPLTPEAAAAAARVRQQAFASRLAGQAGMRHRPGAPAGSFVPSTPGRAFAPPGGPRPVSSPAVPAADPKAAVDALRRRYEDSMAHARGQQAVGNVQAAEAALAKGDYVEAARRYRAASETSSDPRLRAALAETETKAKDQGHAKALAAAKEAEEKRDFGEAGAGWARAFDILPSAETAHRASLCLRRAGVDSRRAAHYGEEAVKLDPNKASYRVNLALVYADLGLSLRARGEIDRAHALDPQSAQVKEAIARIKAMK